MADRMLFVGWGATITGREERALEVFNDAIGFYGRCQQEGRIESFDVVLLEPHGGGLHGYVQLHGSADQLAALREADDFQRLAWRVLAVAWIDCSTGCSGRAGPEAGTGPSRRRWSGCGPGAPPARPSGRPSARARSAGAAPATSTGVRNSVRSPVAARSCEHRH
jgi:hypothetical protein